MDVRPTIKRKKSYNGFWVLLLGFVFSYVVPLVVQVIANCNELNQLSGWGKIINGSGVLWEITAMLIVLLFIYASLSKQKKSKSRTFAITLSAIIISVSFVIWICGIFFTKTDLEYKLFFILASSLIVITTIVVAILKIIIEFRSKNSTKKIRRTKSDWLYN